MHYDVVIVEDDEDLGQMIEFMLSPLRLSTFRYRDPSAFTQAVAENLQCRLLVMDMLLCGADGRDICSKLRGDASTGGWSILLMSAHPDAERSCLNAGADTFVSKPFDLHHFRQTVTSLLQTASAPTA